jgi:hypothetical protein
MAKLMCSALFPWTNSPFDHSGYGPEDLVIFAAISNIAKNVGD